jgi:hypothetical protein
VTKIIAAEIDMLNEFGRSYGNSPSLYVTVDEEPNRETLRWKYNEEGHIHYAEQDGWLKALWHDGDGENHGGFGGAQFPITMEDGTKKILAGPWLGSAGAMNKAGMPQYIEVSYKLPTDRIYTFGWWLTVDLAIEALKLVRAVEGKGSDMFRTVLVLCPEDTISGYTFAVVKDCWSRKFLAVQTLD